MTATRLLLIRHGETAWSLARRHTGRTDVALTPAGEAMARALPGRLDAAGLDRSAFAAIWSSPLRRARDTAGLAGFTIDRIVDDLAEWDYGAAEGRTTAEIREERPGWDVWRDGVVGLGGGGETVDEVGARADRVIAAAGARAGTVVLVAHAHVLRVLTARWLGLTADRGCHLTLDPVGWALLGWERETPVIERWNPPG